MRDQDPNPERRAALESRLGYTFKNPTFLARALTHRSYAYETGERGDGHYERLEFLGDAMLGFLVSDWLWRDDAEAAEGVLSRRRQAIVRATTLAQAARDIGLGEELRLGRGEEGSGGRAKPSLLADVFEAVLGAVYADGGVRAARAFVRRHLGRALRASRGVEEIEGDYKTQLQEAIQGRLRLTPRYRIVATSGPAHAMEFRVEVMIGDDVWGTGRGSSRKQAEQQAARKALRRLESPGS